VIGRQPIATLGPNESRYNILYALRVERSLDSLLMSN
jgi:hypothetical protein